MLRTPTPPIGGVPQVSASRGLLRFFMVGGVLGATLSHRTRRTSHPATSYSVLCHGRSLRNCWFLFRAVRAISADMRAPNLPRMMLQGLRCVLGLSRGAKHSPLELSASRGLLRFFMVRGVLGATLSHRTRRASHPTTSYSVLCHGRSLRICWFLFRAVRAISADMRAPNLPE